jgi:glutamate/tyrosine decarboxylase-like PLP-dependent enzyme
MDRDLERRGGDRRNGCAADGGRHPGDNGCGAIDPLPDLARFCRAQNLWFHVDAAWGGAAVVSPRLRGSRGYRRRRLDHLRCAKWFSVPMGAGMFFCRHHAVVREAFRAQTVYMPGKTAGPWTIRHVIGSMVAPVHRLEAISLARRTR